MANFVEHITQAKSNLDILTHTNKTKNNAWDWQVTMCFYVAVHLVNGHLAKKQNLHYTSHKQVNHAISPYKSIAIGTEFPDELYKAYIKLQNLSRRSRYLCIEKDINVNEETCHFTYDKHLKKALAQLDKIMQYIQQEHSITFSTNKIDCVGIKNISLAYFKYTSIAMVA
jgi:hypothetical protein